MSTKHIYLSDLRPLLMGAMRKGLNQSQLAKRLGLSRATINSVVHGEKKWMPRYCTGIRLVSLCDELGVSINAPSQHSARSPHESNTSRETFNHE